jgi:Kef-type K+ transport system membrane component KefB
VALVGVVAPFLLGFALGRSWGLPVVVSVFLGAALTARILADLRQLDDPSARVVLGAAVIDDVLGLLMLSIVGGFIRNHAASLAGIAVLLLKAVAFLVIARSCWACRWHRSSSGGSSACRSAAACSCSVLALKTA